MTHAAPTGLLSTRGLSLKFGGVVALALGFGTQRLLSRRAAFAPPPPELDGATQTEQVRASAST